MIQEIDEYSDLKLLVNRSDSSKCEWPCFYERLFWSKNIVNVSASLLNLNKKPLTLKLVNRLLTQNGFKNYGDTYLSKYYQRKMTNIVDIVK